MQKGLTQSFKHSFDASRESEIAFREFFHAPNQIPNRQLQATERHVLIEIPNNCIRYKKTALSKPSTVRQDSFFNLYSKWLNSIFQFHTSLGYEPRPFALNRFVFEPLEA